MVTAMARALRAALRGALFFAALQTGAGCGAPSDTPATPSSATTTTCVGGRLAGCGRALADARLRGVLKRESVVAYLEARRARDVQDPWARLWDGLAGAPAPGAVWIVGPPTITAGLRSALKDARFADVDGLPAPEGLTSDELLLSLADVLGAPHVVRADAGGLTHLVPRDPLAPFTLGLTPSLRSTGAANVPRELAIAAAVRTAFEAAGRFDYVGAAHETDALSAALKGAIEGESVERGSYARRLLDGAGIGLDRETTATAQPSDAARSSPYAELIAVRSADEPAAAWLARRGLIEVGLRDEVRPFAQRLFAAQSTCEASPGLPPMGGPADLALGWLLVGAFDSDFATAVERRREIEAWQARYDSFARTVEKERAVWAVVPTLLYQRGEISGLSPEGSATYGLVTGLGLAHFEALARLAEAEPKRFRPLTVAGLVMSPGALTDERLRTALATLSARVVGRGLEQSETAGDVAAAVFTSALAGASYPASMQAAHYTALEAAAEKALRGPVTKMQGWDVAGLYAANMVARWMLGEPVDLPFSSGQIARSLEHTESHPALAALAVAGARYASLAAAGGLDPEQRDPARFPAERKAARANLAMAIAGLGEAGEAPRATVEDLTTLADGIIAVVAHVATRPEPRVTDNCNTNDFVSLRPEVARAVAKLGDVRQRLFASPSFGPGKSTFARRARPLGLVLSDTLDLLQRKGPAAQFALSAKDADAILADAATDVETRPLIDALASVYTLARAYAGAETGKAFWAAGAPKLQRLFGSLALFLAGEEGISSGASVLFATLAKDGGGSGPPSDPAARLAELARHLSAENQLDASDLALLSAAIVAATVGGDLPADVSDTANKNGGRATWAASFFAELGHARGRAAPRPEAFREALRSTKSLDCEMPSAEPVLAVLGAVRAFSEGRRAEARKALDGFLRNAEQKGFVLPKVAYRYQASAGPRVFQLSLDLSLGAGLVQASTFQLGAGVWTERSPASRMTVGRGAASDDEAARYFAHVAALSGIYDFLDGDPEAAVRDASRALGVAISGVRLGTRTATGADRSLSLDARPSLAVLAQLAMEAKMPLLAGDLWTVVANNLDPLVSDDDIDAVFDPVPLGLAGLPDADALVARTLRSLRVVAEPRECTRAKVDLAPYDYPGCDLYHPALAFRVADAARKLPRLSVKNGAAARACPTEAALDRFLGEREAGGYDPDALTQAAVAFADSRRPYDAAVLLTRLRADPHCSPTLVGLARKLGREPSLGAQARADLLSVAVNCNATALDAAVVDDLATLDDELATLPDASRSFGLLVSTAQLAVESDRYDVLTRLVDKPGFISRWSRTTPTGGTVALVVDHASRLLTSRSIDSSRSEDAFALFCRTYPAGPRAKTCTWLDTLRTRAGDTPKDRTDTARSALRAVFRDLSP